MNDITLLDYGIRNPIYPKAINNRSVKNMEEKNMPEKKFTAGGITAAIWMNPSKDGKFMNRSITIDKRYKDNEGNWKSTGSVNVNEIPKVILVLEKAYEHLVLKDDSAEE